MGTRADFYVGRGPEAEWLGSIAWDGYPEGIDHYVLEGITEDDYRRAVERFLSDRGDATRPEDGWPWPWDDSGTTDYAYAFDGDTVYASPFGRDWFRALNGESDDDDYVDGGKTAIFPDMSERKNVQLAGKRSGTIVITGGGVL
jgi:hypothetical protein